LTNELRIPLHLTQRTISNTSELSFCTDHSRELILGSPTFGFSGSGGAGDGRKPTREIAGEVRIPFAAKPLSACKPGLGWFYLWRWLVIGM
jgi:hypothetical protein